MNKLTPRIRHLLLSLLLLLAACATPKVSNTGIRPEITAPFTLDFLGDTYTAGYSAVSSKGAIVEYFLPAEGPGKWTRLLALRLESSTQNSTEFINGFQHVLQSKGTPHEVTADPANGGNSINFMALIRGNDPGLEFNIFRAIDRTNQPGIISFQYAEILNKKGMTNLAGPQLRTLRNERNKAFQSLPFPTIELSSQPRR